MMPNSYIINSSRSEILDENALVSLLKDNKIAFRAGLDVFSIEKSKYRIIRFAKYYVNSSYGSATVEEELKWEKKL